MNINYLIFGVVSLVFGVLFLIWNIKNPLKEDDESLGADDFAVYDGLNKRWNQKGILVSILGIILGLILIYEGITGVSPI